MNYKLRERREPTVLQKPRFDRDQRDVFLQAFALSGLIFKACRAAGIVQETYRRWQRDNIEGFADEAEEAKAVYRESLEAEIHRRAVDGVPVPLLGGKDRDKIIVTVQEYSDRLLEFHAKRHIPEYREKQQIDLNMTGGVIAIPVPIKNDKAWETEYSEVDSVKTIEGVKTDTDGGRVGS